MHTTKRKTMDVVSTTRFPIVMWKSPHVSTNIHPTRAPVGIVHPRNSFLQTKNCIGVTQQRYTVVYAGQKNQNVVDQETPPVLSTPGVGGRTFTVVITGGSKGAGRALASKFLEYGDNVVICSRDEERVESTVQALREAHTMSSGRIEGIRGDVACAQDMNDVARFAAEMFGSVDIWVNNAGTNAYTFKPFFEQSDEDIASVVNTNVLGVMYGTKAAINVMKHQPKGGHVFNMDGAGADGNATPRFAAYGATKRSLEQLNKSIRAELSIAKISNVGIHAISPGMVTTELLMAGADNRFSRLMINCLAEEPETMADFLVPRIRQVPDTVEKSFLPSILLGQYIKFLTPVKAYSQIILRLVAGQRKDRYVIEDQDDGDA